jgi:hypothetical protein
MRSKSLFSDPAALPLDPWASRRSRSGCKQWWAEKSLHLSGIELNRYGCRRSLYWLSHFGKEENNKRLRHSVATLTFFFFPVPVCAITASGMPGGTLVSMNRFSTLCGWLAQRQGRGVKGEYDQVSNRDRLKLTPDLTTRWATRNDNFVCSSLWDFKSSFTCRKILRHGIFPLYSIREEGVLRIFTTLKNPSLWPGFEPATFGSSGQHTNHYTTKATITLTIAVKSFGRHGFYLFEAPLPNYKRLSYL